MDEFVEVNRREVDSNFEISSFIFHFSFSFHILGHHGWGKKKRKKRHSNVRSFDEQH